MTDDDILIKKTLASLKNGDPISDIELGVTIKFLQNLLSSLDLLGQSEYRLFIRDIRDNLTTLAYFEFNRKFH
jgi:hypothetical protein